MSYFSLSIGVKEQISIPDKASFRVLKWEKNIENVFSVSESGDIRSIRGEGTHWHYHPEVELIAFTEGSGIWFVGDNIKHFKDGSVVLIGSNLPHYWHVETPCSGIAVQFQFVPSHAIWGFSESYELIKLLKMIEKGISYSGDGSAKLIEILSKLTRASGLERLGLFFELISYANHVSDSEKTVLSSQTFWLDNDSDQQNAMRIAMHHILTHYREEISLHDLLSVTHMSRATFSRYFKKHSGKTLYQVIQEVRIEAACRDLINTSKSITEIGYESGFSQISFFNRVFRRFLKCSPSDYRSMHQK